MAELQVSQRHQTIMPPVFYLHGPANITTLFGYATSKVDMPEQWVLQAHFNNAATADRIEALVRSTQHHRRMRARTGALSSNLTFATAFAMLSARSLAYGRTSRSQLKVPRCGPRMLSSAGQAPRGSYIVPCTVCSTFHTERSPHNGGSQAFSAGV